MSPREPHLFRCAGSTLRGDLVSSRPLANDPLVELGAVALGYAPRHVLGHPPYTAVEVSRSTPSDLGSSLAIGQYLFNRQVPPLFLAIGPPPRKLEIGRASC